MNHKTNCIQLWQIEKNHLHITPAPICEALLAQHNILFRDHTNIFMKLLKINHETSIPPKQVYEKKLHNLTNDTTAFPLLQTVDY